MVSNETLLDVVKRLELSIQNIQNLSNNNLNNR